MHAFEPAGFAALLALRDGPALLLDLEEGTIRMLAAGGPVALYARLAAQVNGRK